MTALPSIIRAPSLLALAFLALAACETVPARPPIQPGSGDPRVEPGGGEEPAIKPGDTDPSPTRGDGGLTPPFMSGKDVKRAAVLLPFSHSNAAVRTESEAMLAGIELALFEYAGDDFLIMPYDTEGPSASAEARANEAIANGADIILGPLFAANVPAVRNSADRKNVPVIAFSNDRKVAGSGVYLASILADEEVSRATQYAFTNGVTSFAFIGPDTDYGRQVESALRSSAGNLGASVLSSVFYDPKASPNEQGRQLATILKAEIARTRSGKIGVVVPDKGTKLLSIVPLLPYNGVNMDRVQFIGTSLWDDASIWREPVLEGAIYAGTDPENLAAFKDAYQRIYGRKATDLAAVAYDAAAVAVRLAGEDNLRYNGVTDPDGFMGVNGLFRFRLDGTAQRGLAIKQIAPGGAAVIEPGPKDFKGES